MHKLIIKNTEELSEYLAVPATFNFDGVAPHVSSLQSKWLKPFISPELFEKLIKLAYGESDINEYYLGALNFSRYVVAQILMRDTTDLINLSVTQGGFTVNNSENNSVASANRVLLFKEQLTINAQIGIDQLHEYLEENANELTEYKGSDARKIRKGNFIPDAKTFSQGLIATEVGHFVFEKMRAVMSTLEARYLIPALGPELYAELKTKTASSESLGVYAPILPLIQKAIPGLVFAECAPNMGITIEERGVFISYIKNANEPQQKGAAGENIIELIAARHRQYGMERMEDLTQHLLANKDDYPLFSSSTAYTDRETDRIEPSSGGVYYGLN